MPEILTDAYLLFTFVFKQALNLKETSVSFFVLLFYSLMNLLKRIVLGGGLGRPRHSGHPLPRREGGFGYVD